MATRTEVAAIGEAPPAEAGIEAMPDLLKGRGVAPPPVANSTPSVRRPASAWVRLGLELVIGVALVRVLTVVVVAFAFDDDDPAPETRAVARSADPGNALCEAAVAARQGDRASARQIFFGRAHQPLHELAATVEAKSRAAAAALLEAKAKLEGGSGLEPPASTLSDGLDALAVQTGRATAIVGGNDQGPCERSAP